MMDNYSMIVTMAAQAREMMEEGDSTGEVGEITDKQLAAEDAFRKRAYAAYIDFPDHPLAPALAAFHKYQSRQTVNPIDFRGLAWLGYLLNRQREDWVGQEKKVGARLRSPKHTHNFLSCVCELQAANLFRERGFPSTWLWPTKEDDADVIVNGELHVECLQGFALSGLRVPARSAAILASRWLQMMARRGRGLRVSLIVENTLEAKHVQALEREIGSAIQSGSTGMFKLSVAGYRAEIEDLSGEGRTFSRPGAEALLRQLAAETRTPFRWGDVYSPTEDIVHVHLVTIQQIRKDSTINAVARAVAAKHKQVKPDQPNLVYVEFGLPVPIEQASNPAIQLETAHAVEEALVKNGAHRVSGVIWAYRTGVVYPRRGFLDAGPRSAEPKLEPFAVLNPIATTPLPERFLYSKSLDAASPRNDSGRD